MAVKTLESVDGLALPGLVVVDARVEDELFPAIMMHRYSEPLGSLRCFQFGPVFFVARGELNCVEDGEDVGYHHSMKIMQPREKPRLANHTN